MTAVLSNKKEESVLLLMPRTKLVIPLSTAAFGVAQGPKRKLSQKYKDSLVLFRTGALKRIKKISAIGPYGTGFIRRLVSILTSTWTISTELEPCGQTSSGDFGPLLSAYIRTDSELPEPFLSISGSVEETLEKVANARNAEEVFSIIAVPPTEDCLDVL